MSMGRKLFVRLNASLRAAAMVAGEVADELWRLNRRADAAPGLVSLTRGDRVRAFKASLAESYREHNRCC